VIQLKDSWTVRNLKICVRSLESLPAFAKGLVDLLIADRDAASVPVNEALLSKLR
jgi:hypothetical protein